ncbi:MAG: type II toxin-antitoxin system prevent-host-death family antitoxin [Anaerolineales bacterium]|nr:type II toxin-antitoxin system prevent-host-death family antitoxin [Anaerolineales bacterium]MDO9348717.1 type II toxin-antitoxin system prevent-host-death family antitoxin [Anaerolineales bacterium]MDP2975262.1 type II toxin-antitoxin system prevent-host-death family antitoxin [Anaerolineales bacterium]MDP3184874.1 type II toxin-antitoxin system prevent-host-death family antitoxin [Anaerolineales bacterium]
MNETRVGTRELKSRLSEYLRRVKAGQTVVVTERGKVIGQIVPVPPTLEERLRALADAGFLEWNGKKMRKHYRPKVINRSDRLISDIVVEDRR